MKLLIALAIVVAPLTVAGTSSAAGTPSAGCPASKELLSIAHTLNKVDFTIYDAETEAAVRQLIADLDTNGNNDGFLCSKQFKPNQGQDKQWGGTDYVITQISDNQPAGRL